jgi:hypothetical protein
LIKLSGCVCCSSSLLITRPLWVCCLTTNTPR